MKIDTDVRRSVSGSKAGVLAALVAFVLAAVLGKTDLGLAANVATTRWLQSLLDPNLVEPLTASLILGSNFVCLGFVAAYGFHLWRRGRGWAALAPGLLVVVLALEVLLKSVLAHPPVWPELYRSTSWYVVPNPGEHVELPYPFPSGHALRLTFLVLVVASIASSRRTRGISVLARLGAWVLALLGAASVVYLGWHWTTDAVGGVALGYVTATGTTALLADRSRRRTISG